MHHSAHSDPESAPRLASTASASLFRLLTAMSRLGVRGSYKAFTILERAGLLKGALRMFVDPHHPIYVPLGRRWDRKDVLGYESALLSEIALQARTFTGPLTLVDCGADLGVFSVVLASRVPAIRDIVCFEPSREAFPYLKQSLAEQPCRATAIPAAVSDVSGKGELKSPEYDADATGRFLVTAVDGGVSVTTIDEAVTDLSHAYIIKIDIEGGELAALRGARTLIETAKELIVVFEAHFKVAARTGADPVGVLQFLAGLRDFSFTVAERPDCVIALDKPLFEQLPPNRVYNIVARTPPFAR